MNIKECFYCSDEYKDYFKDLCTLKYSRVYLNNEQEYLGRTTVVYKDHKCELFELTKEELNGYMNDVARVANAVKKATSADKINYAIYGDIDSHIHFHIVPKHINCRNWGWPFELTALDRPQKFLTDEQYKKTINKIKQYL